RCSGSRPLQGASRYPAATVLHREGCRPSTTRRKRQVPRTGRPSTPSRRSRISAGCALFDPVAIGPARHEGGACDAAVDGFGAEALGDGELLRIVRPVFSLVRTKHLDPVVARLERITAQLVMHANGPKGPQGGVRGEQHDEGQRSIDGATG